MQSYMDKLTGEKKQTNDILKFWVRIMQTTQFLQNDTLSFFT